MKILTSKARDSEYSDDGWAGFLREFVRCMKALDAGGYLPANSPRAALEIPIRRRASDAARKAALARQAGD